MSILVLAFLGFASAFSVDLLRKDPYCFAVMANQSDTIQMNYHVSGKDEHKIVWEVRKINPSYLV